MDKVIYDSDIILEVVDARMPNLARNEKLEDNIRRKRKFLIIVMNKSDLITGRMKMNFLRMFRPNEAIFVSCKDRVGIPTLKGMIFDLAKRIRYRD